MHDAPSHPLFPRIHWRSLALGYSAEIVEVAPSRFRWRVRFTGTASEVVGLATSLGMAAMLVGRHARDPSCSAEVVR